MKILLDEMLTGSKEVFEALGWEVVTANDSGLNGKADRVVVQYAKENDCILVTRDELPYEISRVTGVRCFRITDAMIANMASEMMKQIRWDERPR